MDGQRIHGQRLGGVFQREACFLERVRGAVEEAGFPLKDTPESLSVTVSIGLAFHRSRESGSVLINRADAALYASKNGGRNIVTLAAAA